MDYGLCKGPRAMDYDKWNERTGRSYRGQKFSLQMSDGPLTPGDKPAAPTLIYEEESLRDDWLSAPTIEPLSNPLLMSIL